MKKKAYQTINLFGNRFPISLQKPTATFWQAASYPISKKLFKKVNYYYEIFISSLTSNVRFHNFFFF